MYGTKSLAIYLTGQSPEIQAQLIPYFRSIYDKGGVYGRMYLSYYVEFVIENLENQLKETKAILAANKKNNTGNRTTELKLIQAQQESNLKELKVYLAELSMDKN